MLGKCTGCTIEKFVPKKRVHQLLGMYIVAYTNKIWYNIHRVHNESSAQGQGTIYTWEQLHKESTTRGTNINWVAYTQGTMYIA